MGKLTDRRGRVFVGPGELERSGYTSMDTDVEARAGAEHGYGHKTFEVRLTRTEIQRLAGVLRTDGEYLDECGKGGESQQLILRASELYIIADRCR